MSVDACSPAGSRRCSSRSSGGRRRVRRCAGGSRRAGPGARAPRASSDSSRFGVVASVLTLIRRETSSSARRTRPCPGLPARRRPTRRGSARGSQADHELITVPPPSVAPARSPSSRSPRREAAAQEHLLAPTSLELPEVGLVAVPRPLEHRTTCRPAAAPRRSPSRRAPDPTMQTSAARVARGPVIDSTRMVFGARRGLASRAPDTRAPASSGSSVSGAHRRAPSRRP